MPAQRQACAKALAYMDLTPGQPLLGPPGGRGVHRQLHQRAHLSDLRQAAQPLRRAPGGAGRCGSWSCPARRQVKRQAEAEGLDRIFRDGGRRVARAGLQHVHRHERRPARSPGSTASAPATATSRAGRDRAGAPSWPARSPPLRPPSPASSPTHAVWRSADWRDHATIHDSDQPGSRAAHRQHRYRPDHPGPLSDDHDKAGLGRHLFAGWRYDAPAAPRPDFPLNQPDAQGAQILLAGDNFGCGSSREHAPWALLDFGFRAVISTSFADIFRNNALKNGLLPVVVDPKAHRRLLGALAADPGAV